MNEQIIIGDNIRVTVVSIRGNQVRLGFQAPADVPIFREELRPGQARHESLPGSTGLPEQTGDRSPLQLACGRD